MLMQKLMNRAVEETAKCLPQGFDVDNANLAEWGFQFDVIHNFGTVDTGMFVRLYAETKEAMQERFEKWLADWCEMWKEY